MRRFVVAWLPSGLVLALSLLSVHAASGQNGARLRYGFQPGRQYAYEVKIHADLQDSDDFHEGILTYTTESANEQQVVLRVSGSLPERSQPKPNQASGPMFGPPRIGPPRFMGGPRFAMGGPQAVTINRQGEVVVSRELSSLPFALGDMETLMLDEFPADGRAAWDKQRESVIAERNSSSPFPHMMFGPMRAQNDATRRTAKERTDYSILENRGDLIRFSKKYQLRTEDQAGQAPRFAMSGSGEIMFNAAEGVNQAMTMRYEIQVNEPNLQVRVPVTVDYRLLTAEELAAVNKRAEEARIAAEKANAPKEMGQQERTQSLRELRSGDPHRMRAAADRLAKAIVDDNPVPVAKALAALLRHSDQWVQGAAAAALETWATPEVEEALIAASTSENLWVRARAINALGKIPSEAAADAVAAQMYRNRHEAGKALKAMGPIAEAATIGCLKDRDEWVRKEACGVLNEVGGNDSLKPLRDLAARGSHMTTMDANHAIGAIQQRLDNPSDEPAAPVKKRKASLARATASEEYRKWHDTSGSFEVEAAFQEYQDRKVTLKKKDGGVIRVPVDKLSSEDQLYILDHARAGAASSEKPEKPAKPKTTVIE